MKRSVPGCSAPLTIHATKARCIHTSICAMRNIGVPSFSGSLETPAIADVHALTKALLGMFLACSWHT